MISYRHRPARSELGGRCPARPSRRISTGGKHAQRHGRGVSNANRAEAARIASILCTLVRNCPGERMPCARLGQTPKWRACSKAMCAPSARATWAARPASFGPLAPWSLQRGSCRSLIATGPRRQSRLIRDCFQQAGSSSWRPWFCRQHLRRCWTWRPGLPRVSRQRRRRWGVYHLLIVAFSRTKDGEVLSG